MSDRPRRIAVFDSGLGGLSVLLHLRRLLPHAGLVYLADQARAPYGDRAESEVLTYSAQVVAHLTAGGCDAVVVACNTASSVALEPLRAMFPTTPIIGMEPAVKPAAASTASGVIAVLATTRTVEGERLARLIAAYAEGVTVITQACPGLVELVEDGLVDAPETRTAVRQYIQPLVERGADTLVLGCTHYSFLEAIIREEAGEHVTVIDPAEAVARRAATIAGAGAGEAMVRFETTGDPVRLRRQLTELLGTAHPTFGVDLMGVAAP